MSMRYRKPDASFSRDVNTADYDVVPEAEVSAELAQVQAADSPLLQNVRAEGVTL